MSLCTTAAIFWASTAPKPRGNMIGILLVRGITAGYVAGVLSFGFAQSYGEHQVAQTIAFEGQFEAVRSQASAQTETVQHRKCPSPSFGQLLRGHQRLRPFPAIHTKGGKLLRQVLQRLP